jgi:hypothetical protein
VSGADPLTQFLFEYGTTSAYGQGTTATAIGSGPNVSAAISGLTPGTSYHFRLVVVQSTSSPQVSGQDVVFTTPAAPGTVATTAQATSITATSGEVNGVTNTSALRSSWFFEYGKTPSYGRRTASTGAPAGVAAVSAKLSGLSPLTTYHFRLVVEQGSPSNTEHGADRSFTTSRAFGTASLRSRHVKVHHAVAKIRFKCRGLSGTQCTAEVSLSTRTKGGKHGHLIGCGKAKLATSAGHNRTVKAKLGNRCEALLKGAPGVRLKASLHAILSTHQAPLRIAVTLVGT